MAQLALSSVVLALGSWLLAFCLVLAAVTYCIVIVSGSGTIAQYTIYQEMIG